MSEEDDQPAEDPERDTERRNRLSVVVVTLLKGPLFRDRKPDLWHVLRRELQAQVRDHVQVLGLELVIDDAEGYAFLRSLPTDEADPSPTPRLMARRPLTFEVSVLLALLRKRLAELDGTDGDEARLIMTSDDIVEMLRLFLPDTTNEAKVLDRVDRHINRVIDLGFLRRLDKRASPGRPVRYEVQRIIKAFVDGQWLSDLDHRLAQYRQRLDRDTTTAGDGGSGTRVPTTVTAPDYNSPHDRSDDS